MQEMAAAGCISPVCVCSGTERVSSQSQSSLLFRVASSRGPSFYSPSLSSNLRARSSSNISSWNNNSNPWASFHAFEQPCSKGKSRVIAEGFVPVIESDSSGGEGIGGTGDQGGGGGGGGDDDDGPNNNNSGGNSEGGEPEKKKLVGMSLSQKLTLGYAALVGAGGVMGYVKGGSQKSLAAGGLSALGLLYVYSELPVRSTFASTLGFGLSAALLMVMGSRFQRSKKLFPAGVVSFVSLIMAGGYLHGLMHSLGV